MLIFPIRFIFVPHEELFRVVAGWEKIKQLDISINMVYKYICWNQGDMIPAFADLKPRKKYVFASNLSKGKRMKSIRMELTR